MGYVLKKRRIIKIKKEEKNILFYDKRVPFYVLIVINRIKPVQ
jgi:hypothetical protein